MAGSSGMTIGVPIESIQVDGLVVLKIIQHCEQEGGGPELVQGVLVGLIDEGAKRLEITNCFPFPSPRGDDDDDDSAQVRDYQMEMMRLLREVNVDHMQVGWYQSTFVRSSLNKTLVESQLNYQKSIEESIVLLYDPLRTRQGCLSLKAYRLSADFMALSKEAQELSLENFNKSGLSFERLFEEVSLVIKNSHLIRAFLLEMGEEEESQDVPNDFLGLGTSAVLEKNVHLLMEGIEEIVQDTNKLANYQRQVSKHQQQVQQQLHKRQQENTSRAQRGEDPLPEEDVGKLPKAPQCPSRLESLLMSRQVDGYCREVNQFASQSFGKLFLAKSLQEM
ncbi:eukaryotic translation initiation factor 3 subunit H-like [Oscarella lobularis]|uniref:eukaryotic translation initiation factor 3 subunit H-like n=1 Tax=Oscarella lobularis TaxID=121494 RepID=UPI0033137E9A